LINGLLKKYIISAYCIITKERKLRAVKYLLPSCDRERHNWWKFVSESTI